MDYRPYSKKVNNEDLTVNFSLYKFLIILMLIRAIALMYVHYNYEDLFNTNGFLFVSFASLIAIWLPVFKNYRIFWDVVIVLILSIVLKIVSLHLWNIDHLFTSHYAFRIRTMTPFFPIAYLKYKLWKMEQR